MGRVFNHSEKFNRFDHGQMTTLRLIETMCCKKVKVRPLSIETTPECRMWADVRTWKFWAEISPLMCIRNLKKCTLKVVVLDPLSTAYTWRFLWPKTGGSQSQMYIPNNIADFVKTWKCVFLPHLSIFHLKGCLGIS